MKCINFLQIRSAVLSVALLLVAIRLFAQEKTQKPTTPVDLAMDLMGHIPSVNSNDWRFLDGDKNVSKDASQKTRSRKVAVHNKKIKAKVESVVNDKHLVEHVGAEHSAELSDKVEQIDYPKVLDTPTQTGNQIKQEQLSAGSSEVGVSNSSQTKDSGLTPFDKIPVIWEVVVDGLGENTNSSVVMVHVKDDHYWVSKSDLIELGLGAIQVPDNQKNERGQIDLKAYGTVVSDTRGSRLFLSINPEYRQKRNIDFYGGNLGLKPTNNIDSTFLNYSFSYKANNNGGNTFYAYSGDVDVNVAVSDTRFNYQGIQTRSTNNTSRYERISTNLIKDDLEHAVSYLLGDGYSNAGVNANPVRFSGIQIAKDFGLQPGFLTQPKTDIDGLAASPSTLDIFINNIKVRSTRLNPGSFSITNLSGLSEGGTARIVIKDALGNEKLINVPLFGGAKILRKGLSAFAFQAGLIRQKYNTLDGKMASGYYRRGVTNWLTGEVSAEYASKNDEQQQAIRHHGLNFSISTLIGNFDLSKRWGTGQQSWVSYNKSWRFERFATYLNINRLGYSDDYQILGAGSVLNKYSRNIQMGLSYKRINTSYLNTRTPNNKIDTLRLAYATAWRTPVSFGLNATRSVDLASREVEKTLSVDVSVPFVERQSNRNRSLTVSGNRNTDSSWSKEVRYSDQTTNSVGSSYGVNHVNSQDEKSLAVYVQNSSRYAQIDTEATASKIGQSDTRNDYSVQASVKGAVVIAERDVFLSQPINNGFVLVDAEKPNVGIKVNDKLGAVTNKDGRVVVSDNVYALHKNEVSLDPETAPNQYTGEVVVVSNYRKSGSKAVFVYPSVAMLIIEGKKSGVLYVANKEFPITKRGCFVELPPGKYEGVLDDGLKIYFEMPKSDSGGLPKIQTILLGSK